MSDLRCDNCLRGEDEVEIHQSCEDCLEEGLDEPSGVPPAPSITVERLHELLGTLDDTDTDFVEHVVTCHSDGIAEYYRQLAAAVERIRTELTSLVQSELPG